MSAGGREAGHRAVWAAFAANLGVAAAKFVGFVATGSASMLAEAIHSVADTSDQGLLLLGAARARRSPNASHPFGYGHERYFWAFVVAVVLFTAGGLFALLEAEKKLRHPQAVESLPWAVGILAAAMVCEGISLRTAVRRARPEKADATWLQFVRRSKSAELPVVLLEDSAALTGLMFAMAGVVLAGWTGDGRYDAVGSLGIGVLLVAVAFTLGKEMKSLLIGEAASDAQVGSIRRVLEDDTRVRAIHQLRTQQLGPHELMLGVRVEFWAVLSGEAITAAIADLEHLLRQTVPEIRVVYLQPEAEHR